MHVYRNNFLSFLFLAVNNHVISMLIIDFSTLLPKTDEVNVYSIKVICSMFKLHHVLNSYVQAFGRREQQTKGFRLKMVANEPLCNKNEHDVKYSYRWICPRIVKARMTLSPYNLHRRNEKVLLLKHYLVKFCSIQKLND